MHADAGAAQSVGRGSRMREDRRQQREAGSKDRDLEAGAEQRLRAKTLSVDRIPGHEDCETVNDGERRQMKMLCFCLFFSHLHHQVFPVLFSTQTHCERLRRVSCFATVFVVSIHLEQRSSERGDRLHDARCSSENRVFDSRLNGR